MELKMVWAEREIETNFDIAVPVESDGNRIAQLFSNLLSNAITHGDSAKPVAIHAFVEGDQFHLSISNAGDKIPAEKSEHLFEPFFRGENENNKEGLGLGLYIANEIARAHKGQLTVLSTDESTTFTLRMPITYNGLAN